MSANCAAAVGEMIDAVEYGTRPWPIFFSDLGCGSGQWPPEGENLNNIILNTPFSMRQAACNQAPGVPAELLSSSTTSSISIENCPLPMIQSGIIPPGFKITFYASNPPDLIFPNRAGGLITVDPGVYVLQSTDPLISSNNLLIINQNSGAPKWGSSVLGPPGSAQCSVGNTAYPSDPTGPWFQPGGRVWPNTGEGQQSQDLMAVFDGLGQQKLSLYSCGSPFWPSLTSVLRNNDTFGTPQKDAAGDRWNLFNRGTDDFFDASFCYSTSFFDHGATTGSNNSYLLSHYDDDRNTCKPGGPTYTTGDCVGSLGGFTQGVPPQFGDVNILGCACTQNQDNPNFCALGDTCACPLPMQGNGSLDRVQIELSSGSWEFQQFMYCIGQPFSLGGIPIQRYGNSTVACDPIVTSLCQNTAFLASNAQFTKACACVLEQQRFNIQFAGLNLPVQCFSSVCADNDPNVYRTVNQSSGCSARLCSQIITINGSAIAAEGYQTMLCDGQTYTVNTSSDVSPGPVPLISPGGTSNVNLGPTFYIALGLLGVMILLLVAWGIRKWVVSHRNQLQQRKEILKSLEGVIQN